MRAVLGFVVILATSSCATLNRMNIVSEQEEIRIGSRVAALVDANAKLLDDPSIQDYVEGMTNRVASVSDRTDLYYRVRIIEDESVNAVALPGGYMYVMAGLLDAARSESELASVLSHEVAHIALGHAMRRYTKAQLFNIAAFLGSGYIPGGITGSLASSGINVGTALAFLKFSRADESEADRTGMSYLIKAGYDPQGAVSMMEALREIDQKEKDKAKRAGRGRRDAPTIFATHPRPEKRAERLTTLKEALPGGDAGGVESTLYFAMIKRRLSSHSNRLETESLLVPDLTKKGDVIPDPSETGDQNPAPPGAAPASAGSSEPAAAKEGEEMPVPVLSVPTLRVESVAGAPPGGGEPHGQEAGGGESAGAGSGSAVWLINEKPIPRLRFSRPPPGPAPSAKPPADPELSQAPDHPEE